MRPAVIYLLAPPLVAIYVITILFTLDPSQTYAQYLMIIPLAYLLGSIPWGFMLIWTSQGKDIREYGSGRIGASNVLRSSGGRLAALVLILDASKGVLAVLLARLVTDSALAEVIAGLLTLVGHNWSMFIGFKGGRGIAPGAGALGVMSPVALAIGVASFATVTLASRYLSLGSLISVVTSMVVLLILPIWTNSSPAYIIYGAAGGLMIIWQHRDNIQRLLKGNELRLGRPARKLAD